jgi:hypothetical protein
MEVSIKIACDVSGWYYSHGKASTYPVPDNLEDHIRKTLYNTDYVDYNPRMWEWPKEQSEPRSFDEHPK